MTGTLATVYTASTGLGRKKFDDCWNWLYSQSANFLRTTKASQASRVQFLINQIPSIGNPVKDTFYALGGGRPYKTLTEAEFAASRTQYLADAAIKATADELAADWAAAQNAHINANVYFRADLVAGLRAAANEVEAG